MIITIKKLLRQQQSSTKMCSAFFPGSLGRMGLDGAMMVSRQGHLRKVCHLHDGERQTRHLRRRFLAQGGSWQWSAATAYGNRDMATELYKFIIVSLYYVNLELVSLYYVILSLYFNSALVTICSLYCLYGNSVVLYRFVFLAMVLPQGCDDRCERLWPNTRKTTRWSCR